MSEDRAINQADPLLIMSDQGASASFNMALDEALLVSLPWLKAPVLRFYSWTDSAASFGYFQKHGEVEKLTALRPLVRRPTAGGIVPHDADWTYSLVFPCAHEWYSTTAVESYRRIHEWLRAAFLHKGVVTELASAAHHCGPGQCFVGYEKYDLLWRGRKIAGAAQRRTRVGLLIQGSVQPPRDGIVRRDWEDAMQDAARQLYGFECARLEPSDRLLSCARDLERKKYGLASYNRKR